MKKLVLILMMVVLCELSVNAQFKLTNKGFVSTKDETKDQIVIDMEGTAQELFTKTKKYLSTIYNSPKTVIDEVGTEQITIDAIDSKEMRVIFSMNGPNIWQFNYKYVIQFKDGKLRITPYFKRLLNTANSSEISLIGSNIMGTTNGVFNNKGKCLKDKAKEEIEASVNGYVLALEKALKNSKQQDENW